MEEFHTPKVINLPTSQRRYGNPHLFTYVFSYSECWSVCNYLLVMLFAVDEHRYSGGRGALNRLWLSTGVVLSLVVKSAELPAIAGTLFVFTDDRALGLTDCVRDDVVR